MRILAIETTDKIGSVAAFDDANLLAELVLDHSQRSAQSLAPAMRDLLIQVGWSPSDVQLLAVSIGPGSFTGLRVGVTAAKVFAYAVGAEVLGVNTLEAIAANCIATQSNKILVVMDAQRGEVVVQSFVRQADGWFAPAGPQDLLDADVWLARLSVAASGELLPPTNAPPLQWGGFEKRQDFLESHQLVTGPGLVRLFDRLPPGVAALDQSCWHPRASAVGRLAARYHAEGRRDDLWKLVPHYYRRSAAEEKWDARMAQP